ncbi:MAG: metal-dependent hydrolase [Candidatus Bilamarchaeum sp.]|jgi:membrane-bound metal-dependent hydrolase YbcI (DUF457 family)
MNWKQHVLVGLVFGALLCVFMRIQIIESVVLTIFCGLCALLPDLDHQMSKGREILDKAIPLIALIISYYNQCIGSFSCLFSINSWETIIKEMLIISGAYFLVMIFLKPRHRGITHTLGVCFGFGIILYFALGLKFALFGSIGYLSHLVADQEIKIL